MFIGATPLEDSFKKHDPVTPMLNSNLVEVLEPQTAEQVGLIPHGVLVQGTAAVESHLAKADGKKFFIADTADDADLERICEFVLDWPLTTGADALPVFLARAWRQRNGTELQSSRKTLLPPSPGREAVIAGSCAGPTLRQLQRFAQQHPLAYKFARCRRSCSFCRTHISLGKSATRGSAAGYRYLGRCCRR